MKTAVGCMNSPPWTGNCYCEYCLVILEFIDASASTASRVRAKSSRGKLKASETFKFAALYDDALLCHAKQTDMRELSSVFLERRGDITPRPQSMVLARS